MKRWIASLILTALLCGMMPGAVLGADQGFSDVKNGDWYAEAVMAMAAAGVVEGCPDGSFQPKRTISHGEFVTIVARMAGISESTGQTGHWAAGYLQAALEQGWYDWDEIPPTGEKFNQAIYRQLAVKILMKALFPEKQGKWSESERIHDFSSLSGRYYDSVLAAYACGLIEGDSAGNFCPEKGLSRAEACTLLLRATKLMAGETVSPSPPDPPEETTKTAVSGGVSENGWLQVIGTQLCNEAGEPVVLRGMSTHGLQWYGDFASGRAIENTAKYGANLFRIAMYTAEGGYLSQKSNMKQRLVSAVDAALRQDMYTIIDWHILSDGNPQTNQAEAVAFFEEMARRYKNEPGVIYEICNEPNGSISWSGNVKPYAQTLVSTIRKESPKAVILIGSPTWSQDIHLAAADPVKGTNLMYTLHFYAGTHGAELRQRIDNAIKAGLAIFVSEWGVSRADGSGGVFTAEAGVWLDFLKKRNISWANWSLCDKNETSAALKPGTPAAKHWTDADLSPSGAFVFAHFR